MVRARAARNYRLFVAFSLVVASTTLHGPSKGDARAEPDASGAPQPAAADPDAARRARLVLTVGSRKVTVGELEDHIAGIPQYQLQTFGGSREAVARAYIEQVLARDLVLVGDAEQRGLDRQLPT